MVAFIGVSIVMLSVLASIGVLSFSGVGSTLIIVEVIPFLVLAVGVDNIFIFVQHFNRIELRKEEIDTLSYDQGLRLRMKRLMSFVAPSILLAAFAESSCFFLGSITPMPAVRIFAINAGLALLISFILQMLILVPVIAFDARRKDSNRYEIFCFASGKKSDESVESDRTRNRDNKHGLLFVFFSKIYAPFLMKPIVKLCVVSLKPCFSESVLTFCFHKLLLFGAWLGISISVVDKVEVGLEQSLSMPTDSYVLDFFDAQIKKLKVGPPVYFVVKGDHFNYIVNYKLLCGQAKCSPSSLAIVLSQAANISEESYIVSTPANNWVDDYISWLLSDNCNRLFPNGTFCPSTGMSHLRLTRVSFLPPLQLIRLNPDVSAKRQTQPILIHKKVL